MDECGNILNSFCPPPILVHGPSGTGKSTIVRQILKRIEKEASMATCRNRTRLESSRNGTGTGSTVSSSRVSTAYVNCKTIEPYGSGASSILQSLYRQLEQGFHVDPHDDYNDDAIVGTRGQVENMMQGNGSMSMDLDTDDDSVIRNSSLHPPRNIRNDCNDDVAVNVDGDSLHDVQNDDEEELIEYYAAKERRGIFQKDSEASTSEKTFTKKSSIGDHAGIRRTRRSARLKTDHGLDSSSKSNPAEYTYLSNPSSLDSTNVSSSTTVSFGRSIAKFCGVSKYKSFLRGCAFIVLDHADELLSFSHNRQKGNIHTNFLSELLLLPKTMKLNLTVIAITDKLMLEQSSK
jgi:Cdc6-like AAA superfamily ATPase